MIQPTRVQPLNDRPEQKGRYVLYWMQQAQRVDDNHALVFAMRRANELALPLVVFFGLTDRYPGANLRHYAFLLEGLTETHERLTAMGARFTLQAIAPEEGAVALGCEAALAVVDAGYLRRQRQWRAEAARRLVCPLIQVESDVVVPLHVVSDKAEYAARTIRPKIYRHLDDYLLPLRPIDLKHDATSLELPGEELTGTPERILNAMAIDRSVSPAPFLRGGATKAQRLLREFIERKLDRYATDRNDPTLDALSSMSPYLHFGQISPLTVALAVRASGSPGAATYLEELIVRRELAMNYAWHQPLYDAFAGLPAWAQQTLVEHARDRREHLYTPAQWEAAQTHDPYWNAAQRELTLTGKMHGYMRMYWGKKLLEWSRSPAEAFDLAVFLNDKYELDGRDANGYTGVAWCLGLHDRPWARRPVLGTVRYMNAAGLKRKFDADAYVAKVASLE